MPTCPGCGGPGGVQLLKRVVECVGCENSRRMRRVPPGLTSRDLGVERTLGLLIHRSVEGSPVPAEALAWIAWRTEAARDANVRSIREKLPKFEEFLELVKEAKRGGMLVKFASYRWHHREHRDVLEYPPCGYDWREFPYMLAVVEQ